MKSTPPSRAARNLTTSAIRSAAPPCARHSCLNQLVLNRTKKGLAVGGTGLTFDHLLACTRNGEEGPTDTLFRLAKFATMFANGEMCSSVGSWFAPAPMVPLRKDVDGLRPIAVGDTLRRLVSKVLMARVRKESKDLLYPKELVIGVSSPGESVSRALHSLHRGKENDVAILKIDLKNAFTLVNRPAILKAVAISNDEVSVRREMIRKSAMFPRAKQWLLNSANVDYAQHIPHRHCNARMAYHCSRYLFPNRMKCWRRNCDKWLDNFGDHLLTCPFAVGNKNCAKGGGQQH